jgi:GntR family transcriptional regulator
VDIDPDDRAASWEQLARILRDRISSGQYRPGKKIPSNAELQDESGLSPNTIKRALDVLKKEGLLEGVQGRGVFVVDPLPEPAGREGAAAGS